jgi:hypothetical protein
LGMQHGEFVTVKQKNGHVRLPVTFDERLPLRGVFIAGGIAETSGLSELFGSVVIEV